ncbi:MAG: pantoate--beta-alanine ligase [Saprospiraceae bacterium]|nr:pantoate--beta-alanine ligase [Saprospiraceae bacterium]MDZ4703536.1 pantoate--beta-alanine ligase [Saprospiraceae bacterium]
MYIFYKAADLRSHLELRVSSSAIGFIPTMGALHEGHLALIRAAQADGCYTVCSIFVNPTQFNDPSDLDKYPRTPEKDTELLAKVGCDVIFMPEVEEIYPPGANPDFEIDFEGLDLVMEGFFRPGHFKGVAQVVKRLLDLVGPDKLYMGQKDFQQVVVVRHLIRVTGFPVELIVVPTVREEDGLAMSSRNARLSPGERRQGPVIYQTLLAAKSKAAKGIPPAEISREAMSALSEAGFTPEYFDLVSVETLQLVGTMADAEEVVACVAAWLEGVRLIDNMAMK